MPKLNAAFYKWFGKSVVRNEDGTPKVVYRGDRPDKTQFTGCEDKSCYIQGNVFFTDSLSIAKFYTRYRTNYYVKPERLGESDGLYRVYLSLQNPLLVDAKGEGWDRIKYEGRERQIDHLAVIAKKRGYDGLVVFDVGDQAGWGTQYIAFHPEQIKSIDNDGTWDADDPSIRSNPPAENERYYMSEACPHLAIYLHRKYGWPIYILFDDGSYQDFGRGSEREIAHVFVVDSKNTLVDAKGRRTVKEMKVDFWDLRDPKIEQVTEDELISYMGNDRPLYDYSDSEVKEAGEFAEAQIKSIDNDGTWDADDPDISSNPPIRPVAANSAPREQIKTYNSVGRNIKGFITDTFDTIGWDVDSRSGLPEHDEVAESLGIECLARMSYMDIPKEGIFLHVDVQWGHPAFGEVMRAAIGSFTGVDAKAVLEVESEQGNFAIPFSDYAKLSREAPDPQDYEHGDQDKEFKADVAAYIQKIKTPQSIAALLGRRKDDWHTSDPSVHLALNPPSVFSKEHVIKHLKQTDGTGDPDWLEYLESLVAPFDKWVIKYVDPSEIECECSDRKTAEDYAANFDALPPVVLIPNRDGPRPFEVVDGAHRIYAASILGVTVPAYVPAGSRNPSDPEAWKEPFLISEDGGKTWIRIPPGTGFYLNIRDREALRSGKVIDDGQGWLIRRIEGGKTAGSGTMGAGQDDGIGEV